MAREQIQRIAVIGSCGAGKSTLSRRLGELLALPVIHLDQLNWRPDWNSIPQEQWRQTVCSVVNQPRWIIDGNYGCSLDIRTPAADMIIFLDFPRWLCMWRIIRRIAMYQGQVRPDMGEGCPERLDWEFLEYVWNFPTDSRPTILRSLARHGKGKRIILLRTPREVEQCVCDLETSCR